MIAALKAEFRKLLTVRSTLFLFISAFLVAVGLIGFWIYGYKDVGHAVDASGALASAINSAVTFCGVFFSFLVVLLVGHEYRYNTIVYSLTSTNRRSKVFLAKCLAPCVVALVMTVVIVLAMAAAFFIGHAVHGTSIVSQHIAWWPVVWRSVVSLLGSVLFAFIIATIVRSLIGAIAVVLLLPSTIEGLLTFVLKDNAKYLPYTALGHLTSDAPVQGAGYLFSLAVVGVYVVVVGLVSYILFVKRDAN